MSKVMVYLFTSIVAPIVVGITTSEFKGEARSATTAEPARPVRPRVVPAEPNGAPVRLLAPTSGAAYWHAASEAVEGRRR
jgi:hypothetical protein